jgi:hypothetical protein
VPAEYASLGIADAVYSRMGSADDVSRDRSTFLVEMLETAAILRGATARSLVVMDEVGRGTTPEDGARGRVRRAARTSRERNGCRALFATHFHALADMTAGWGCVARLCTDVVVERGGGFYFSHRMREGVSQRVARAEGGARWRACRRRRLRSRGRCCEKLRAATSAGCRWGVSVMAAVEVVVAGEVSRLPVTLDVSTITCIIHGSKCNLRLRWGHLCRLRGNFFGKVKGQRLTIAQHKTDYHTPILPFHGVAGWVQPHVKLATSAMWIAIFGSGLDHRVRIAWESLT